MIDMRAYKNELVDESWDDAADEYPVQQVYVDEGPGPLKMAANTFAWVVLFLIVNAVCLGVVFLHLSGLTLVLQLIP